MSTSESNDNYVFELNSTDDVVFTLSSTDDVIVFTPPSENESIPFCSLHITFLNIDRHIGHYALIHHFKEHRVFTIERLDDTKEYILLSYGSVSKKQIWVSLVDFLSARPIHYAWMTGRI